MKISPSPIVYPCTATATTAVAQCLSLSLYIGASIPACALNSPLFLSFICRYWQKRYALLAELGAQTDCEWFGGVHHTVKAIIAALSMIRTNEVPTNLLPSPPPPTRDAASVVCCRHARKRKGSS